MNITEYLVSIIEKEGIVLKNRKDVYDSIDLAIQEERFSFISQNEHNIGFFTWKRIDEKVFVNNLFIFKAHRGFNLCKLRGILKEKCGAIGAFQWWSRKKGKVKEFNRKGLYANHSYCSGV